MSPLVSLDTKPLIDPAIVADEWERYILAEIQRTPACIRPQLRQVFHQPAGVTLSASPISSWLVSARQRTSIRAA